MERLKRLRAAQLNKTYQKEVVSTQQRKLQEERDRAARESLQRAAYRRSPSPPSPRCQQRLHTHGVPSRWLGCLLHALEAALQVLRRGDISCMPHCIRRKAEGNLLSPQIWHMVPGRLCS